MKKKIASLVVAATLVTGMGGFGTYSYFSDKSEVTDNVNIVTGRFDIEANWEAGSEWVNSTNCYGMNTLSEDSTDYCLPGQNHKPGDLEGDGFGKPVSSNGLSFTNVKPGDVFERNVVVRNEGTLAADTTIKLADTLKNSMDMSKFEITLSPVNGNNATESNGIFTSVMDKNSTLTFKVSVKLKVGDESTMTGDDLGYEKVLNREIIKFIDVKATQTNRLEAQAK